MNSLNKYKQKLKTLQLNLVKDKIRRDMIDSSLRDKVDHIYHKKSDLSLYQETLTLLQEICSYSRDRVKDEIQTVVTSSIQDVFGDPTISFKINYDVSHNKVVANFVLVKKINGQDIELDILDESGGGVADVVSLALRIVLLLMQGDKASRILILDEPFPSVSNYSTYVIENLGKWINNMCEKFDLQIFMITQKDQLAKLADKCYTVENINGESICQIIE